MIEIQRGINGFLFFPPLASVGLPYPLERVLTGVHG